VIKIFRFIFWLRGWKLNPDIPKEGKRSVLLASPHTSNWDFVYGLGGLDATGLKMRFTIKKEWMRFPLRFFMRALGALGIDRTPVRPGEARRSMVDAMTDLFKDQKELAMVITPEGTRKRATQWHTGFYYVALQANVPILLGYCDYAKKEAGIGKVIWPSAEGFEKDMREIMAFYSQFTPKYPENFSIDERFAPEPPHSLKK
jgi:1-acyl-sn-glycerol-3-phosphate acyltransferase